MPGAEASELLKDLEDTGFSRRLWERDVSLWNGSAEDEKIIGSSLGWLTVPGAMLEALGELNAFSEEVNAAGFTHAVLLGMGGSSLAPLVFSETFGSAPASPKLVVLDSTDPFAVRRVEDSVDLAKTLFIVSSKSGSTIEPLSLYAYFRERLVKTLGNGGKVGKGGNGAGSNFIAITDPGSHLEELSAADGFRRVFINQPDIGGRFSALSYFGLVPAAIIGMDVGRLLEKTLEVSGACGGGIEGQDNPALVLGASLGALALKGRDKVTFLISEGLQSFGLWIEQLLAESTGKEGKGLTPITGEPLLSPSDYPGDRVFVSITSGDASGDDRRLLQKAARLKEAGHPVIDFILKDRYELGGEFFRWEVATAVVGAVLKINPFDQPDVEDAKQRTRALLSDLEAGGVQGLSVPGPAVEGKAINLIFGEKTLSLMQGAGGGSLDDPLKGFKGLIKTGGYVGILPYIDTFASEEESFSKGLSLLRKELMLGYSVATQFGFGPRYLHSIGQLHKGGPAGGVFLVFARSVAETGDVMIPGKGFGFGGLILSQALGDTEALEAKGRPVAFVEILGSLQEAIEELSSLLAVS